MTSENVIIEMSFSCGYGIKFVDEYDSGYTHDEWEALTEEEQAEILNEAYQTHVANYADGGAWVKNPRVKE